MQQKILIYYTGTIGDTIVALPAFDVIRECYPETKITVLSAVEGRYSAAQELLASTTYADSFDSYSLPKNRFLRIISILNLMFKLRLMRYQAVILSNARL